MRRGEILNLKWSNIDFGANQITLRETKSGRMRHVPIHPDARNVLEELPREGEYVFFDKDGSAINGRGRMRTGFEKAVERAGLKDFTFHDLRHTFASELVMKGADLKTVSELMGHSTTRMTERYAHLSPAHKSVAIHLLALEDKIPDPSQLGPNLP